MQHSLKDFTEHEHCDGNTFPGLCAYEIHLTTNLLPLHLLHLHRFLAAIASGFMLAGTLLGSYGDHKTGCQHC